MTALRRTLAIAAGVLIAVAVLPAAASADAGATGRAYGSHIVMCAQGMGFTGQHNPGMHHGFSGWDPAHSC